MNFIDVQPHSFLDYAWTSPTDLTTSTTSSRTSTSTRTTLASEKLQEIHSRKQYPRKTAARKQNRCCDQCRKGKRACDAAILEDALLNAGTSGCRSSPASVMGESPSVFHYSDVFGTLAPCGNCAKTKKSCTFEWLRSQRVLQAKHQQQREHQERQSHNEWLNPVPVKKRRKQREASNSECNSLREREAIAPHAVTKVDAAVPSPGQGSRSIFAGLQQGITGLFLQLVPEAFEYDVCPLAEGNLGKTDVIPPNTIAQPGERLPGPCSFNALKAPAETYSRRGEQGVSNIATEESEDSLGSANTNAPSNSTKKRRHHSTFSDISPPLTASSNTSISNDKMAAANKILLTEALLKIYQQSFENHLSCWLTEKTCPVNNRDVDSSSKKSRPDWNYVYHCVFQLDRLPMVRGRPLSSCEEKATSKALNLAVFAFASQWVNSNGRREARFPFREEECEQKSIPSEFHKHGPDRNGFDRVLQMTVWNQARVALAEVESIQSFRAALALIVFSLTEKPHDAKNVSENTHDPFLGELDSASELERELGSISKSALPRPEDTGAGKCKDMLSGLKLLVEGEGPPVHLERGLRLLHSLRSRMAVAGIGNSLVPSINGSFNRPGGTHRAIIDLLFWLAIIFDTLSAAIHKRQLVVSPEDSEFPMIKEGSSRQSYDEFLFSHRTSTPVRWPCSNEKASGVLCSAAPIKVLLFRKVTRLQSLMTRGVQGRKIENAVSAALEVYEHWRREFSPFFLDVFGKHNRLPARLRAWSICLAGHWHLATLLLADLMEMVDDSGLGMASRRRSRCVENFIAEFREKNCRSLSDIARSASPDEGTSLPSSWHMDTMLEEESLLIEPWTVVLIRAFATAGVYLLESTAPDSEDGLAFEDNLGRANNCISALWYLGQKSHMAQTAAKMLAEVLMQRRRRIVERDNRLHSFVAHWADIDQLDESLDVDSI